MTVSPSPPRRAFSFFPECLPLVSFIAPPPLVSISGSSVLGRSAFSAFPGRDFAVATTYWRYYAYPLARGGLHFFGNP